MRARRLLVIGLVVATLAFGLGHRSPAGGQTVATAPAAGFDLRRLDPTCDACTDFYGFATGGWEKANPIPPEYASWSSLALLNEQNLNIVRALLDHAAADPSAPAGGNERKLGVYYKTCLDEAAVEAAGTRPLEPEFVRLAAVSNVPGLVSEIAHLEQGVAPGTPFDFGSSADPKDSSKTIGDLGQDGLTLPERDYYLNPSPASAKLRDQYVAHVAKMLHLAGDDDAAARANAATVLAFETKLAQASFTNVELRDVAKTTNHYTLASLQAGAPNMQWASFFRDAGAPLADLNVDEPSFFTALDALLASAPLTDWKTYLRWRIVDAAAPALPKAFVDERFAFTSLLNGTTQQQPRWKRCVAATGTAMDQAVGELYVKSEFSAAAKARALEMVDNLQATLRDDLATLPWMSPSTRKVALQKIDKMRKKIGYPDRVRDFSALVPQTDSYLANRYRAGLYAWNYDMAKIGKPTDRDEWGFPPQIVNAQYDPANNDVTFPAGILQPPFYNVSNDDALNYGAIGAVIGHEMTHGFDDQGRLYDPQGSQADWWTAGDVTRFNARAACVSKLYDTLPVDATLNQKGALVLGEAIADLGGTTIAFKAFERAQAGKPATKIQGFTPEQRFFLAYANVWADNTRPEAARLQANTDVHALARNRVTGTLENMPQFAQAWACPLRAKMVRPPAARCQIW